MCVLTIFNFGQVENYMFRVHRYFFERESAFFREKLAIPAAAGQSVRGSSDSNPFSLEDIQAVDFSRFLWVFYNPYVAFFFFLYNHRHSYDASYQQILHLRRAN